MKLPTKLEDKKKLYAKASKVYYESARGESIMTDSEFDSLESKIKAEDPKWVQLQKTGVRVTGKTEVALTHFMPSLHKKYPEAYPTWRSKQSHKLLLYMAKLDGSSLQLTYNKGVSVRLVTRGNGTLGGDISFLIPYLHLPKIKSKDELVFRTEAVIKNSVFAKKYAADYENPRAASNGWLNRKQGHAGLKDVDIVVLGVYGHAMQAGLEFAANQGFKVVDYGVDALATPSKLLAKVRKNCEYDADGIVLCDPKHVLEYHSADKPKWIIAYKENDVSNATSAVVEKIIWQNSRLGRWIPKLKIKPVRIGGVTVTHATVHNAKWMIERKIGPGAVVKLVRSGDVIPKIVGVEEPGELQMPEGKTKFKGVHLVSVKRSKESDVREIHHFFSTLGIDHIAGATVSKLYDAGLNSVANILQAYTDRKPYAKVSVSKGFKQGLQATHGMKAFIDAGLGEAMTFKIFGEFDRVLGPGVLLRDLMVASNCFENFGEGKLKIMEKHYVAEPNVLADFVKGKRDINKVKIKSIGESTKEAFTEGLECFKPWLRDVLVHIKVRKPEAVKLKISGKLSGVCVTFTSYRDESHERWITDNGGEVVKWGKQTQVLLYKAGGKKSTKLDKASEAGIKVLTFEEFKRGK